MHAIEWASYPQIIIHFRLRTSEVALQSLMVYRASYENELAWLERVERTINNLRRPEDLHPEEYQEQLDILVVSLFCARLVTLAFASPKHVLLVGRVRKPERKDSSHGEGELGRWQIHPRCQGRPL